MSTSRLFELNKNIFENIEETINKSTTKIFVTTPIQTYKNNNKKKQRNKNRLTYCWLGLNKKNHQIINQKYK